jgi:DNA topoisomerase IA
MVPTELGIALIDAFELTEPAIVRPDIRAKMEQQVALIAGMEEGGKLNTIAKLAEVR